jgi:hypothetical protein
MIRTIFPNRNRRTNNDETTDTSQNDGATGGYVSLPKDAKKHRKRKAQEIEEGINDDRYACPLCHWGDSGITENTSYEMSKLYETYNTYFKRVSDRYLYRMIARYFNVFIVLPLSRERMGVIPEEISEAQVEHHFTVCDIRHPLLHVWSDIEFCKDAQDILQRGGVFFQGMNEVTIVDSKQSKLWFEFSKQKLNLLKYADDIQKRTEANRTLKRKMKSGLYTKPKS